MGHEGIVRGERAGVQWRTRLGRIFGQTLQPLSRKCNRDGGHVSVCPFTQTISWNRLKRRLRMKRILLAVVAMSWLVGGATASARAR